MFNVNIIGDSSLNNLSTELRAQVEDCIEAAASLWGRYIDATGRTLNINLNVADLGGNTLASAGTSWRSSGGPTTFDSLSILATGTDPNGADGEVDLTIDLDSLLNGDFFITSNVDYNLDIPNDKSDLLSVLVHELGHGFGIGLISSSSFQSPFQVLTSGTQFIGTNAVAANGGQNVQLTADRSHFNFPDVMFPTILDGTRLTLSPVDIGVIQDIGAPIAVATSGANTLYGFELVNDTISGLAGNDQLFGLGGNDTLFGGDNSDTLDGGNGNDNLYGGLGSDTFIGGVGGDYVRYDDANYGNMTVSLKNSNLNQGTAALGDTFNGIEGIIGGLGNDILFGNDGGNTLIGGGGNDQLGGGLGADVLNGGVGGDYVRYDDGNYGDFQIVLSNSSLNTGAAAGDTFVSIEGAFGGIGNETIVGDAKGNTVKGGGGNDRILGSAGNDMLAGGTGQDTFVMNTALNASTNVDTIVDFFVADDKFQLDDAIFTQITAAGNGFIVSGQFNTGTAASQADDRIIYNSATGALFYDSNGNVGGGSIQFATISTGLTTLSHLDFQVI